MILKLICLVGLFVCINGCQDAEGDALLPIPLKLHQPEASILKQLGEKGYKVRDHIPNEQLGDSIPLAGLDGVTTYFFHPDGFWHGIHFAHTDSSFQSFLKLRALMGIAYGSELELTQQPQTKQGYAVWKPDTGQVRIVRLSANRGKLQLFMGDSTALSTE